MTALTYRRRFTQALSLGGNGAGERNMVVASIDATPRAYFAGPPIGSVWRFLALWIYGMKLGSGTTYPSPGFFGAAGALPNGCDVRVLRAADASVRWALDAGVRIRETAELQYIAGGSPAWHDTGGGLFGIRGLSTGLGFVAHIGEPMLLNGNSQDRVEWVTNDNLNAGAQNISIRAFAAFDEVS